MVQKITFYDKDEAIQYQIKMRQEGRFAKILRAPGKYEVVVSEGPSERKNPVETPRNDSGEST